MLSASWSQVPNSCLAKLTFYTSESESCSNEGAVYSFIYSYVGFQQTLLFQSHLFQKYIQKYKMLHLFSVYSQTPLFVADFCWPI